MASQKHTHNPTDSSNCNCNSSKALEKFPKSSLITENKKTIGHGDFGSVVSATLNGNGKEVMVMVNILHAPIGQKRYEVLQRMAGMHHRNVVQLLGIMDTGPTECPQILFKPVSGGNLLEFLQEKGTSRLEKNTLNKFSLDIINGCEYLHSKNFIHGCLAARNILLDHFRSFVNAKISDYGMLGVIDGTGLNYFKIKNGKNLPIRWMPKEAIPYEANQQAEITKPSDVWSFGVVLWEMGTRGDIPYGATISNTQVCQHILNGSSPLAFRRPSPCPPAILNILENIFKVNQDERPTFLDLQQKFKAFVEEGRSQPQTQDEKNRGPRIKTDSSAEHRQKSNADAKISSTTTTGRRTGHYPNVKSENFHGNRRDQGNPGQQKGRSHEKPHDLKGRGGASRSHSRDEKSRGTNGSKGVSPGGITDTYNMHQKKHVSGLNPNLRSSIQRVSPVPVTQMSATATTRVWTPSFHDPLSRFDFDSSSQFLNNPSRESLGAPPPYSATAPQASPLKATSTAEKEKLEKTVKELEKKIADLEVKQKVEQQIQKLKGIQKEEQIKKMQERMNRIQSEERFNIGQNSDQNNFPNSYQQRQQSSGTNYNNPRSNNPSGSQNRRQSTEKSKDPCTIS